MLLGNLPGKKINNIFYDRTADFDTKSWDDIEKRKRSDFIGLTVWKSLVNCT